MSSRGRLEVVMTPGARRPVWAEVDLDAIRHNAGVLASLAGPAELCAVVKAGAYGHGAAPAARAALDGGASWLAVALVEEGAELREAGITAPVLLLSEPVPAAMADVVEFGLTPTLYTSVGVEAMAAAAVAARSGPAGLAIAQNPYPVHVKVDTGMHRVGASAVDAVRIAIVAARSGDLDLQGAWTHFAVADDAANPFTAEQHLRFSAFIDELAAQGAAPRISHCCNSAALLTGRQPCDMVRCGITLYGVAPCPSLTGVADLRPALSLRARVSYVHTVATGEGISYGLRYRPEATTTVATVPVGYADGLPWRLALGAGEVLIGGRRLPIAGAVTMDQILVDCGPDATVAAGDEVVLLGSQGDSEIGQEEITAWEWAERIGTIAYEILCGIGPRVPRVYV